MSLADSHPQKLFSEVNPRRLGRPDFRLHEKDEFEQNYFSTMSLSNCVLVWKIQFTIYFFCPKVQTLVVFQAFEAHRLQCAHEKTSRPPFPRRGPTWNASAVTFRPSRKPQHPRLEAPMGTFYFDVDNASSIYIDILFSLHVEHRSFCFLRFAGSRSEVE